MVLRIRSTKQPLYFSFYLLQASINKKNGIRLQLKAGNIIVLTKQALDKTWK